jgi:transposase
LLTYLHHSHHVSFKRLSRVASELFGLSISQGKHLVKTADQAALR